MDTISADSELTHPTLRQLLLYFLHLGTLGFSGPIALAGHLQKDSPETRFQAAGSRLTLYPSWAAFHLRCCTWRSRCLRSWKAAPWSTYFIP